MGDQTIVIELEKAVEGLTRIAPQAGRGECPPNQHGSSVADHASHLLDRQCLRPELDEQRIDRVRQVSFRIDQRSVQVENNESHWGKNNGARGSGLGTRGSALGVRESERGCPPSLRAKIAGERTRRDIAIARKEHLRAEAEGPASAKKRLRRERGAESTSESERGWGRASAKQRLRPERGAESPSESERGWGPASANK